MNNILSKNARDIVANVTAVSRARVVPAVSSKTFYKTHDLYKFNNKNVIYVAYVGKVNGEDMFKYGKTAKLYEREYNAHRKNFERFDMHCVKITDNKDVVEELFEKELQIRNIHRTAVIKTKRHIELFTINEEYTLNYVTNVLNRIVRDNPSYEVMMYKRKLDKLQALLDSQPSKKKREKLNFTT